MNKSNKYIFSSVFIYLCIGICFWIIDAVVGYLNFYADKSTFLDLLVLNIPKREIHDRGVITILCLVFGVVMGFIRRKKFQADEELKKNHEELSALYEELTASEEELRTQFDELQEQKNFFEQMFIQSSTSTQILDSEGWCLRINPKLGQIFGVRPEHIEGNIYNIFKDEEVKSTVSYQHLESVYKEGKTAEWEVLFNVGTAAESQNITIENKKVAWYYNKAYPVLDINKKLKYVIVQHEDITERKLQQEALFAEKERLRITLQSIGDGVITTDIDGRIVMLNNVAEEMTGWRQGETAGKLLNEVFRIVNEQTRECCENPADRVLKTGTVIELENHTLLISKDGTERVISDSGAPIKDRNGNILGVVLVFRDITEKKRRDEEIRYLSFHDKLTGLFNRAYFEKELKRLDNEKLLPLSLIIGDVNGLKLSNDIFGHQEGDRLLRKISCILSDSCRKEDIIARWGGDEFAVILPAATKEIVLEVCDRIRNACLTAGKDPIQPSIALGSATKTGYEQDINRVLKEAEDRMYRRKLLENRSVRNSIISSLEKTLFERSFETEEHAQRLLKISGKIGRTLKLTDNEQDELNLLAILHDIGKIGISDRILMKPGKLTPEEWEEVKKHPEIGYRISQSSPELSHIAEYILSHHEHWDGNGYPQGLKGTEIPRLSRILTVIDAYDVMTHGRPYKEAVTHKDAVEEIIRCSGTQFDPEIVNIFMNVMDNQISEKEQV